MMQNYKYEPLNRSLADICKAYEGVESKLNELKNSDKPMGKLIYQELLEDFNEYAGLFLSNIEDLIAGFEHRIDVLNRADE